MRHRLGIGTVSVPGAEGGTIDTEVLSHLFHKRLNATLTLWATRGDCTRERSACSDELILWKCWMTTPVDLSSNVSQSQSSTASTSLSMIQSSRRLMGLGPDLGRRLRAALVAQVGSVWGDACCWLPTLQGISELGESVEVGVGAVLVADCWTCVEGGAPAVVVHCKSSSVIAVLAALARISHAVVEWCDSVPHPV